MKNIDELIAKLHKQDIKLWVEGERLRYSVPKGQESKIAAVRPELSERKADIIRFLKQASGSTRSSKLPRLVVAPDQFPHLQKRYTNGSNKNLYALIC